MLAMDADTLIYVFFFCFLFAGELGFFFGGGLVLQTFPFVQMQRGPREPSGWPQTCPVPLRGDRLMSQCGQGRVPCGLVSVGAESAAPAPRPPDGTPGQQAQPPAR